jgi:hypothetical protein
MQHTTRVPKTTCKNKKCGKSLDSATAFRHDCSPKPGDLTVCINCGLVHQFKAGLRLEALSAEEFSELPVGVQNEVNQLLQRQRALKGMR